jgi:hypothetical protein
MNSVEQKSLNSYKFNFMNKRTKKKDKDVLPMFNSHNPLEDVNNSFCSFPVTFGSQDIEQYAVGAGTSSGESKDAT